jgi:hypothetical protein
VRQCVVNNLFCEACTDYYPFGFPNGLAEELGLTVTVFPNPSASGAFAVRVGAGGPRPTLAVVDALGRTIWQGIANDAETTVNLSSQPTGIYILRLTWPDGRAVTKKLMR